MPGAGTQALFAQNRGLPGPEILESDFATSYDLFIRRYGDGPVRSVPESLAIERDWARFPRAPHPYRGLDLRPAGDYAWNEALYRRAVSQYERALSLTEELQAELERIDQARDFIRDPLWWKQIDHVSAWNRVERRVRDRYQRDLAAEYRNVFETLERINRPELRGRERFINLRKQSYRLYAVNQTALGNFTQALNILERYAEFDGVEDEWPLHYYLSVCYNAEFRRARAGSTVGERFLRDLRRRKNLHYLRAVELKFGRESPQYLETLDRIRLEELGSPRAR